ncbi:hypothetical protein [Spiroplasma endosymbiont of Stenodema calcarata]|uniref:hypothetical protein n=1 Tax=Spiroplasma endosymbiont of Stenodema calcarata TaxID=3139328 RepID=UPI003CCACFC8
MEPNYIQKNSKNSLEGKKPDNLCRAGCIVSIVFSSIILAYFVLTALLSLTIRVGAYSDLIGGGHALWQ